MENRESIKEYYIRTNRPMPKELYSYDEHHSHFNIIQRTNCCATVPFQRNDYYKITLFRDQAKLLTEYGTITIDKPCILFSSPDYQYGWEAVSSGTLGYIFLFNESYLTTELKTALSLFYGLFKKEEYPLLFLSMEEYDGFMNYFEEIDREYNGSFELRNEMIQSILKVILLHCVKKRQEIVPLSKADNYSDRVVSQFIKLLENQFPVTAPMQAVRYKKAGDFANKINVHVNHLNRSLKETLGKSTSELIQDRFISEAKSLLQNSQWNIAEISNSLGFEYAQHFTIFFKKHTGLSPKQYREMHLEKV